MMDLKKKSFIYKKKKGISKIQVWRWYSPASDCTAACSEVTEVKAFVAGVHALWTGWEQGS